MIVDATLLLWQKCKSAFGKTNPASKVDQITSLLKNENAGKVTAAIVLKFFSTLNFLHSQKTLQSTVVNVDVTGL